MMHMELAQRAGVALMDLECLVKGSATANVANRLGVSMMDVEEFIRGSTTFEMTKRLGLKTMSAAEELAKAAGTGGAAGIIIGLLLSL